MTVPAVLTGLGSAALGRPAENLVGSSRVGDTLGNVSRATVGDLVRNRQPGRFFDAGDELQHTGADALAEVVVLVAVLLVEVFERRYMTLDEIHDVDVITHTGAVDRWPVVAEHHDLFTLAGSDFHHHGHQVVGLTLRRLGNFARLVRADRVEVAKRGDLPAIIGRCHVADDHFDHLLGHAIGIRRADPGSLGNRTGLGVAIHGC